MIKNNISSCVFHFSSFCVFLPCAYFRPFKIETLFWWPWLFCFLLVFWFFFLSLPLSWNLRCVQWFHENTLFVFSALFNLYPSFSVQFLSTRASFQLTLICFLDIISEKITIKCSFQKGHRSFISFFVSSKKICLFD